MKLFDIYRDVAVAEGIGFVPAQNSYTRDDLFGASLSIGAKVPDFDILFQGRNLYYSAKDSPDDLIRFEEAVSSQDLSTLDPSDKALSSFTGKVNYGFRTTPVKVYKDQVFDQLISPLEKAKSLMGGRKVSGNPTVREMEYEIKMCSSTSQEARDAGYEYDPQRAKDLKSATDVMLYVYNKTPGITGGRLATRGLGNRPRDPSYFEMNVNMAIDTIYKEVGERFMHDASYAMAKILKSDTPAAMVVSGQFMRLCVDQVDKLQKKNGIEYDFVLYPQSSSDFNVRFATMLQDHIGVERLSPMMVSKLPGKSVTIDKGEMEARALRQAEKAYDPKTKKYKLSLRTGTQLFDTAEQYAAAWAANEHSKLTTALGKQLSSDKPLAIKGAQYLDKRRYIKMFSDEGLAVISGKNVLIVDDNVVGGGTVELINDLAVNVEPPPNRVDVFVPLYITY